MHGHGRSGGDYRAVSVDGDRHLLASADFGDHEPRRGHGHRGQHARVVPGGRLPGLRLHPLHQIVSNGLFTQDYGGATVVGTFSGTATATSATSAEATLIIPFIGGTGALSNVMGGSGIATVTVEFVSANQDQSQNFTYALSLMGSLEVVPEPSSLALLVSGLVAAVAFFRWSAGSR